MREWFRWLKWLLVIIIVMFIWWAVATWGGGSSSFRQEDSWAARVNGVSIATATFQSYSILGDQYRQQRAMIGIGRQAINQLVDEELMYQEARNLGISVTEQEVARSITRDPNFLENGQFIGLARYRSLFQGSRISIEEFEAQLRRRLVIEKYRSLIQDGITVSDAEVEQELLRRNEKTTVDYLVVDSAATGTRAKPTDAELQSYYDSHRDSYTLGEGRTGVYVLFNLNEIAETQNVTDEEIKSAYERDVPVRYALKPQRRASHILFKVPAGASAASVVAIEGKARKVLKEARGGADFAALARKHSEDGSASNGGDLNFFGRGQMVKEFEDAAFSLQVGGLSDLVRTSFGFHIVKVTDSREARTVPLEEAREAIRSELKLARARAEISKRSEAFAKVAAAGNLETVAKSQGLLASKTGPVHAGGGVPALAASQAVAARMLGMAPGQVSDPVAIPSGTVVVQVTGVTPAEPQPLPSIREKVAKDLADSRALDTVAEAAREVQQKGEGLKALARRLKTEMKTQVDLARGSMPPGLPPDAEIQKQIGTLPPGTMGKPVSTPSGIVVVSVRERTQNRDENASQLDATRDTLVRQRQDRLYRAVVRRLKDHSRIEVNEPLVKVLDQG
jgi:peptidyl-prolyl cis-trans isomerase D